MNNQNIINIRKEIITTCLDHVPFDGWNWDVVERASLECGYNEDMARAVFPSRLDDVLVEFSTLADTWMLEALEATDIESLKIRDRIKHAVLARLEKLESHKEAVQMSLSYWARPFRQAKGAKIIWKSADVMWDWAGDTSQDYNHYTKRGLLSGIIASTMLTWCNDETDDHTKTKNFLDRRIENVMCIGKIMSRFRK